MLKLAINTATTINNIALISDSAVLDAENWISDRNQAELLQPKIKELLLKNKFDWQDISHLIVVKGPGAFTSLRVGVVCANTIAFAVQKPICGISTFEAFQARLKAEHSATNNDYWLFLSAGKEKAYFSNSFETNTQKEAEIFTLSQIADTIKKNKSSKIYGDISQHQADFLKENCDGVSFIKEEELNSFAESLINMNLEKAHWEQQIEPHYIQQANITMPCST